MAAKPKKLKHALENTKLVQEPGAHAPVAQLRLLNATSWEEFVEDCCRTRLGTEYETVRRLGTAGDGGRDIEALQAVPRKGHNWDLFQCKHYRGTISRSVFFPEMAGFFGFLAAGTYPEPRTYYLCSPMGCGPKLGDLLLGDPKDFKNEFIAHWEKSQSGLRVHALSDTIRSAIDNFDFSRFKELPARDLVEMHSANKVAHYKLFGIKPKREHDADEPPVDVDATKEALYIAALLAAYSEHAATAIATSSLTGSDYEEHFLGSRSEFYSAEGLERFSRDVFEGEYDKFLALMLKTVRSAAGYPLLKSGLDRLKAATDRAAQFRMPESPLSDSFRPTDLPGACHQLANQGKIEWVRKNEKSV